MLISIQYPLADFRLFLEGEGGKVSRPTWPLASPFVDFVRGFGAVRERRRGGLPGWVGEGIYCEANRRLRFIGGQPGAFVFEDRNRKFTVKAPTGVAFRRLYSDGLAVVKIEIGFTLLERFRDGISGEMARSIIKYLLRTNLSVRISEGFRRTSLSVAGKFISQAYRESTTSKLDGQHSVSQEWWVQPGTPVLFWENSDLTEIQIPYRHRSVPRRTIPRAVLRFSEVPSPSGAKLPMWFLSIPERSARVREAGRRLRVCLLRLHAEHECIRLVLRCLATDRLPIRPRSKESDSLQRYFQTATRRIMGIGKAADALYDSEITAIAREAAAVIKPSEKSEIAAALEAIGIRKHILYKINNYITKQPVSEISNLQESIPQPMPTDSKAHVFLSHSTKDKPFVRKLTEALRSHNLNVWLDEKELQVGDSIVGGVSQGLESADYIVVVLSKASVGSRWVQTELNSALMEELSGKGGAVLPVLIEDCELPWLLKDRVYADFRHDFKAGLRKLLAVFEQEGESAANAAPQVITDAPCSQKLSAITLADLRRRMTKRMDRSEISALWFAVLETVMDNDMAGRQLSECVISLLDKAKSREKLPLLIEEICRDRADLANP